MSQTMIRVSNVSKEYRLGQIGGSTLQHELQSWWAVRFGREDPNRPLDGTDRMGRFLALNDVSFDVAEGECLGIIGRNGAGKSTLLKLIASVTAPTRGDIDLYGRVTSMLEVGTGFHREMTGRENIYLNGAILGMRRKEIDAKLDEIIAFSEIEPFIDTPVKRYSSGMYVKLAFSVAVHLDSEIMIMDEVLAVGDVLFQRKCLDKLKKEAAGGRRTVLYVSHNMDTVRQLCDRCLVLQEGKLAYSGDTQTAIGVYMQNARDTDLKKDFSALPRTHSRWKETALLLDAEYVGVRSPAHVDSGELTFRLRWQNRSAQTSISLRVELWTLDDVPRASFILKDLPMEPHQEAVVYDIRLDLHEVVPGDYKMKYTLFHTGVHGSTFNADSVTGLQFRTKWPGADALHWDTAHWGYVCLGGARAERIL